MAAVDTVVVDALDRATDGFLTLGQVSERLTAESATLDPASYDHAHLDALRAAVCFRLAADDTFHGDYAGIGAVPWPRTLDQVSPDVLDIWRAYAAQARSTGLRAHLYDLLTSAGLPPPYVHARQAIEAYREAVPRFLAAEDTNRGRLRAVESLIRALGLAAQMNQRDLRDLVVRDILGLADGLLDADAVPAGLVYRLLEALHVRRLEPAAVRSLIERACAVCDFIQLKVAFLRLLRVMDPDPAVQKGIDRRIVTAMIADADRSTGALRLLMLTDAATVARDAGLTDLSQDVTRKIQAMRRDDLGLAALGSVRVQLSQQELDAARAMVDKAASLAEALWQIAAASAPTGGSAFAQQAAQILMRTAPLASSIPRGRINPVGPVPVSPASSDPLASTQARFQVLNLNRRGLAITVQLDRVRERFDPGEGDLTAVFAHDAIGSASKTGMLVHAFQHFWAGQDDAAVHLALPRVEDLLREIERRRNVPVVSVAQGRTPGGMSQLGSLIAAMPAAGFDQDWTRSFELLLTDGEHGLNLRNEVGHGLCDCPPRHHVALVLHAALFLLAVVHDVIALPQTGPGAERSGTDLHVGPMRACGVLDDDHVAVPAVLRRRLCRPGTDQEPGGRDRHRAIDPGFQGGRHACRRRVRCGDGRPPRLQGAGPPSHAAADADVVRCIALDSGLRYAYTGNVAGQGPPLP